MYIEEVIDSLYGPTPRLTLEDLQFMVDMNEAEKNLKAKRWYYNKTISELNLDELILAFTLLIDNNKMFFRDKWRTIILQEINNKLKLSVYETDKKDNDSDSVF